MNAIEIRLNPELVSSLMNVIEPVFEALKNELATPVLLHEEDELLENAWKSDLLESQRIEISVTEKFLCGDFMNTGCVVVEQADMDFALRACSALRLKLRETVLGALDDSQLEAGSFEDVDWDENLQLGYAAYSLFASMQEIIVSQMDSREESSSESL